MRIQHNIMAMNAYRNYNNNTSALAKNLERLSSGYKINRAGDDAAGLAISEKMRAQITGLEAAQKNVKDGISLVNTAEGAMQEIQDMLNRMVSLATQSANGTYDNEVDRANLQKEVESLKSEINRIADSANFNGINLLDGSQYAGGDASVSDITLPPEGTPIGDKTVLRKDGTPVQKTEFAVQFDNLAINAKAGDKLTVNIGGEDIELTLEEKRYDAKALAQALQKTFDSDADLIGGQSFTAKVGADGTSVVFTQVNDPTGPDDTVEASMDVKMSFTSAAGGNAVVLSDDAGTAASTITGTPSSSIAISNDGKDATNAVYSVTLTGKTDSDLNNKVIDGVSIDWSNSSDDLDTTMSAFVDSYNQTANKDYTAAWDSSGGKLTLTAKEAGVVSTAPTTDVSGTSAPLAEDTAGAAAVPATKSADASGLTDTAIKAAADAKGAGSGNVTIELNGDDKLELKVNGTVIGTSDKAVDGTATSFAFADAEGNSLGSVTLTGSVGASDIADALDTGLTYTAAGDGGSDVDPVETQNVELDLSGALAAVDLENPDAQVDSTALAAVKTALNGLGGGTGKIIVNQEVEVDLTDIDDDITADAGGNTTVQDLMQAIANRAKAAADAWNTDNADKDYTYENARASLSAAGSPDGDIMGLANNTGKIYVLMDKTPKTTGDASMPAAVSGSYNAATVKITQGSAEDGGARASTTIDLSAIFGGDIADGSKLKIGDDEYTFKWGDSSEAGISGKTITLDKNATAAERINAAGKYLSNAENSAFSIGNETTGGKITIDEKTDNTKFASELKTMEGFQSLFSATKVAPKIDGAGLTLQIGDTSAEYNQLTVSIKDMHVASLGIADIDIGTPDGAHEAIDKIKAAINTVSSVRGDLGAISNRLDHTANNLSVMAENITDAESTIRDTDIAEEMMAYTKNNILVQSAQAMLAQANQVPQGVLQLLQ